jgi:hypothetical protein
MSYLITITTQDGETLNAWTQTEAQARLLGSMLADCPYLAAIDIHKKMADGLKLILRLL